jgi:lactate dehydrogenase-like 2-hydroxyacid dehydrogenase
MNIYILTVNKNNLFSKESLNKLAALKTDKVIFITEIQPLETLTQIFDDKSQKIIAIDPMFCGWNVQNIFLDKMSNVRAICLQTTSFHWIDVKYAAKLNIPIINIQNYCTEAVAEWAFMMALNTARRIPQIIQNDWKYDYSVDQGVELKGRTVGIIGLGHIGTRIAELCEGFGMKVQYWSKNSQNSKFKYVDLTTLMNTSDVIFPTIASSEESEKLITDKMLLSLKKNAIFVSIVRNICNEELLFKLTSEGKIFGYANEAEPLTPNLNGNIWSGLRLAWCTEESFANNGVQWTDNIIKATKGIFTNQIN